MIIGRRWPKYLLSHVNTSSRSFEIVVDKNFEPSLLNTGSPPPRWFLIKNLRISPLRRTEPIRDGTGQYGQKCHHFFSQIARLTSGYRYISKVFLSNPCMWLKRGITSLLNLSRMESMSKMMGTVQFEQLKSINGHQRDI